MATVQGTEQPVAVMRTPEAGLRKSVLPTSSMISPTLELQIPIKHVPYAAAKRMLDIILSLAGLIVLSPLFL
ncbi:MAG TPA: hypothetical protein VNJ09_04795, partial [Chthonomonadales bacterium]|nr:hypothetical protein [Chthonomonadales bacterium]